MWSKKKKTLIYLISGILIIIGIGAVAYFVWPKNKSTENEEPTNSNQQIQQLKTELNSLRSKLDNLSDTIQKTQLENKLTGIENQINNSQNNSLSQSTIKKLEQEIKEIEKKLENGDKPDNPEPNSECPYLNETNLNVPSDREADLTEFKKITPDFVNKSWKKGYHWLDILELWKWKIPETDIPDLKTEKRVGVIRELAVMPDFERLDRREFDYDNPQHTPYEGVSRNLVVIVRKIPSGGLKVNISENVQESPMDFDNYDKNVTRDYIQELINFALSQEKDINSQQYEVSVLWSLGTEYFQKEEEIGWGKTSGNSAGSAIYLALLSALHQKPLSHQVCATGVIKMKEEKVKDLSGQEVILKKGDNIPIGGLKEKVAIAVEKGLNRLVLSKYHSAPNILTKPSRHDPTKNITSADYQQVVPAGTRAKMEVLWTENVTQLRDLIFQNQLS